MNVVKEINKINERELDLDIKGSWHDDYKDSAYIFVGGLHRDLTEGDVVTIFSQYGEIMDVNMPRDKETGKQKGFAFVMYEDQRSTVLAVDNLNGAKVLDRTLRVDHVKSYRQPKEKGEDGELLDREEQSLNAKPTMIIDEQQEVSESSGDSGPEIDPEDPMRDYLVAKRKEEKAAKKGKKSKGKGKHKDETPEERQARKERKRLRKEKTKSAGMKAAEELLNSLGGGLGSPGRSRRSTSLRRSRSTTPVRKPNDEGRQGRHSPPRRSGSRDRSPPRRYRSRTPPKRSHSPMTVHHSPRSRPYDDRKRDVRLEGSDRRRARHDDSPAPRTRRGYD
ncbi:hypothetical protein C2E23DRAFT_867143 [Lenzites betulinus]|nr:hypothetical protein C2E23DRAFT_867143 [Lenzites betulinus]